jgi:hypothetical protein
MVSIMPIMAFLLVFLVTYALLAKTKILGGNSFLHIFVSFIMAIVFIVSPSATGFTILATPWIAVTLVMIFFVLVLFAFVHGNIEDVVKSPIVTIILVAVILIIFIVAAVNAFGPFFLQTEEKTGLIGFLISPTILGGIILLIIAAIASWVLTKK